METERIYQTNELMRLLKDYYGFDFSGYSETSFKRRLQLFMKVNGIESMYDLTYSLTNDSSLLFSFVSDVTVHVTGMFRDPTFYQALKVHVLPELQEKGFLKVWHPGCSTGEEVYSMSILLHEAGILERSALTATDIDARAIKIAREGIYPLGSFKPYSQNYLKAGGRHTLSQYYTALYDEAIMRQFLREKLVFGQHNLANDGQFGRFDLLVCRNVLIYFKKELQKKVIRLFYESLKPNGFLALGQQESLPLDLDEMHLEIVDPHEKIYRKIR